MEKTILINRIRAVITDIGRCQDERWYFDGCKIAVRELAELVEELAKEEPQMDDVFGLLAKDEQEESFEPYQPIPPPKPYVYN